MQVTPCAVRWVFISDSPSFRRSRSSKDAITITVSSEADFAVTSACEVMCVLAHPLSAQIPKTVAHVANAHFMCASSWPPLPQQRTGDHAAVLGKTTLDSKRVTVEHE